MANLHRKLSDDEFADQWRASVPGLTSAYLENQDGYIAHCLKGLEASQAGFYSAKSGEERAEVALNVLTWKSLVDDAVEEILP